MKQNKPIIEITALPKHPYFEWFLLGFYELERAGKIRLKINVDWVRTIAKYTSSRYIDGTLKRLFRKYEPAYCVATLHYLGKKFKFCIDCWDEPTNYDATLLEEAVCYFKIQCPSEIQNEGFQLTDRMKAPYCFVTGYIENGRGSDFDVELVPLDKMGVLRSKVRPLMVGPRLLSWGISYKALHKAYQQYCRDSQNEVSQKLMCYFGYGKGANARMIDGTPRYTRNKYCEWAPDHTSPNEKRAVAYELLREMGPAYDARLISDGNPGDPPTRPEMIVPLDEFCKFISNFEYNLNISGNLMSIPNRFIESFMVGTAIMTDKLAVKWYKPFGCEVVETVPMGYLPIDEVDWEQFKKDITNLPSVNKKDILHEFDTKWRPDVVAQYMIDEILKSAEEQNLS